MMSANLKIIMFVIRACVLGVEMEWLLILKVVTTETQTPATAAATSAK